MGTFKWSSIGAITLMAEPYMNEYIPVLWLVEMFRSNYTYPQLHSIPLVHSNKIIFELGTRESAIKLSTRAK